MQQCQHVEYFEICLYALLSDVTGNRCRDTRVNKNPFRKIFDGGRRGSQIVQQMVWLVMRACLCSLEKPANHYRPSLYATL